MIRAVKTIMNACIKVACINHTPWVQPFPRSYVNIINFVHWITFSVQDEMSIAQLFSFLLIFQIHIARIVYKWYYNREPVTKSCRKRNFARKLVQLDVLEKNVIKFTLTI